MKKKRHMQDTLTNDINDIVSFEQLGPDHLL